MRQIKNIITITFITIVSWATLDFIVTKVIGTRGFSVWFQSDEIAGRINTPNLKGFWGGPFDDFYVEISIGKNGERNSLNPDCEIIEKRILFIGDSTTAGFEVTDSETFVSNINSSCSSHHAIGTNLGVRGNDTYSAIGMYEKFSKIVPHDTIFYLVTSNDFWENNDPHEFYNLTRHFGRRFEDEIIRFDTDWITTRYLKFRIFVSDNFYLTTKVISAVQYYSPSEKEYYNSMEHMARELRATLPSMVSLLNDFDQKVKTPNTKLVITMYPCVTPKSAHNWNPNACALAEEIETELYEALKVINPNIEYLESNNLLNHYIDQDCFQRESLTFKRDRHFSKFGHYVFSQILRKHLLNDPNYDRSILCEKPSL